MASRGTTKKWDKENIDVLVAYKAHGEVMSSFMHSDNAEKRPSKIPIKKACKCE